MIMFVAGIVIGAMLGITAMCIVSVVAFEDEIEGGEDV